VSPSPLRSAVPVTFPATIMLLFESVVTERPESLLLPPNLFDHWKVPEELKTEMKISDCPYPEPSFSSVVSPSPLRSAVPATYPVTIMLLFESVVTE